MVEKIAVALLAALCLSIPATAAEPHPVIVATPPQPLWKGLSKEQQAVLAPLAGDWDRMENYRRKKWLGIAQRYKTMTPEAQARVQERMRAWAALSPAERLAAREKYRQLRELDPEQKAAMKQKWQAYEQLPEEEKRRLRNERPDRNPSPAVTQVPPDENRR